MDDMRSHDPVGDGQPGDGQAGGVDGARSRTDRGHVRDAVPDAVNPREG